MSVTAMRKLSQAGIGYSTVDVGDVRHVFIAAVPRHGETLHEQAADVLHTIDAVIHEEGAGGAVVQQTVFLADPDQIDDCRRLVRDFYGQDMPATSYILQPPCGGKLLAIECLGIGRNSGEVEIQRISEKLAIARHNNISWLYCATDDPQSRTSGAYNDSLGALKRLYTLLSKAGIPFHRVIRTWFYCGGITEKQGSTSHYQEMNRARANFYRGLHFFNGHLPGSHRGHAYPASTGIGIDARGIVLGAIALSTDREDIIIVPLENPRQTPACDYSSRYSPASPKFSRAVAISYNGHAMVYISGTASITASEIRHAGDASAQTKETLDNIAELISEENLRRHGLPGLGASLDALAMARVYVKRQEDYDVVRDICCRRLGNIPTIYAKADVCRPELLVEIEGIAFSSNTGTVR